MVRLPKFILAGASIVSFAFVAGLITHTYTNSETLAWVASITAFLVSAWAVRVDD